MRNQGLQDYFVEYNKLLSKITLEHKDKFEALASPLLNKQGTVTFASGTSIYEIN